MLDVSSDPWGAHASTYDRLFAPLTGYIGQSMLAMVDARLPSHARVLDIACGSGALFLPAVQRAQRRRHLGGKDFVTGCDYSSGMVELAREKAMKSVDPRAFECHVQDGQALEYADASYDAVFSCFGIFLFDDRQAGWREAARVLKPGGLFATTTWCSPERNEMFSAQSGPLMAALPRRLTEDMSPPGWIAVAESDSLRGEVARAGFQEVDVRELSTTFVIPNAKTAWQAMVDNPAGGALLKQCEAHELEAVEAAMLRSLHERSKGPDRPLVLEARCNVLVARKV